MGMADEYIVAIKRPRPLRLAKTTTRSLAQKTFLILCPTATRSSGVLETMHALYYLPPAYRLRVEGQSDLLLEEMYDLFRDDALATRIDWHAESNVTGKQSETSPFSFADVVVYGNARPSSADTPAQSLVVFNLAAREEAADDEDHRFTISPSSPEALASAILQVTRA